MQFINSFRHSARLWRYNGEQDKSSWNLLKNKKNKKGKA